MQILQKYLREPINGLTHGTGALLSVGGLGLLLYDGFLFGTSYHIFAFSIFGVSMILLYSASTLYHGLKAKKETIRLLRKLDHSMIFVLIAGSYTPICLIVLDDSWRWFIFIAIWSLALGGILQKLFWFDTYSRFSMLLFLSFGWMGIFLIPELADKFSLMFTLWIIFGGILYSGGTIFLGIEKPDLIPGWFGFHEIWHLFVMGGTFSHFWAFYNYLPAFSV